EWHTLTQDERYQSIPADRMAELENDYQRDAVYDHNKSWGTEGPNMRHLVEYQPEYNGVFHTTLAELSSQTPATEHDSGISRVQWRSTEGEPVRPPVVPTPEALANVPRVEDVLNPLDGGGQVEGAFRRVVEDSPYLRDMGADDLGALARGFVQEVRKG